MAVEETFNLVYIESVVKVDIIVRKCAPSRSIICVYAANPDS